MVPLGTRQNAFVAEYLKDLNATQAALRAGYSEASAASQGARLLKNRKVALAIEEAQQRRSERIEVKQDDVLRVLIRNLTFDIGAAHDEYGNLLPVHKMPEEVRKTIQSIEWGQHGVKVKFWSKDKALELAMRHLGLLKDKVEHSLDKTLEELVLGSMKTPEEK